MAAPLCKIQRSLCLHWDRLYDKIADAFFVRSFHINQQRLLNRKKNRTSKEADGFDKFLANSLMNSPNRKLKEKLSTPQESILDRHPNRLPVPFIQVIRERYRQACRSVVIRTQNPERTVRALSSFGSLKFAECVSHDKQYLIAEFTSESCVKKLQESSLFFSESKKFPLISRCLFDESKGQTHLNRQKTGNVLLLMGECWHLTTASSYPAMANLDEELHNLSESLGLNELDMRARFLACVMVEDLLRPLLPEARVIPYGSCLNGFGWWDSDLDMMLCLQGDPYVPASIKKPGRVGLPGNFKFLTEVFHTERILAQRSLTMVASLLELGPRFNNVHKILNAHVPIVRFHCATLNLQCDISLEAMDSIKMTELLYLYSALDSRVRPLMSGIKQWALSHGLTSSGEQQKPTTIGLLSLLVFYLQTRTPQVLPTLRTLQKAAAPNDIFYIDNVVYGIPSNPSILPKSENTETLENLLHGFFVFFSEFDFESQGISIIEGSSFPKPADSSPLYVENPLCIGLNICKNVNEKYLEAFTEAMKVAVRKMNSLSETSTSTVGADGSKVSSLCDNNISKGSKLSFLFNADIIDEEQSVNLEVVDLFVEDDQEESFGGDYQKDEGQEKAEINTLPEREAAEQDSKDNENVLEPEQTIMAKGRVTHKKDSNPSKSGETVVFHEER